MTGPEQLYGEGLDKNHGWVFEGSRQAGLVEPAPLIVMGRFKSTAVKHPATGYVYLTEDRRQRSLSLRAIRAG